MNVGNQAIAAGQIGQSTMPRVLAQVTEEVGTTLVAYCIYISQVLDIKDTIPNPGIHNVLIHDNLT
jgi:hypothetical protein